MIQSDQYAGTFAMSCDRCDKMAIFYTRGDWNSMLAAAKEKGWENRKKASWWKHYCPECKWKIKY
jgi:hypothetical protein